MPKKKKTRKQKVLTDQRLHANYSIPEAHSVKQVEGNAETVSIAIAPAKPGISSQHAIATGGYGYLSRDLLKTTILTTLIVIGELLLTTYN